MKKNPLKPFDTEDLLLAPLADAYKPVAVVLPVANSTTAPTMLQSTSSIAQPAASSTASVLTSPELFTFPTQVVSPTISVPVSPITGHDLPAISLPTSISLPTQVQSPVPGHTDPVNLASTTLNTAVADLTNSHVVAPTLPAHAEGELIVKFASGMSSSMRQAGLTKALEAIGGRLEEVLPTYPLNGTSDGSLLTRISHSKGLSLEKAIEILSKMPEVEVAEANWTYTTQSTSNDSLYSSGSLWGMYGNDATGPINVYGSQADEAWAKGYTGSTKTVMGVIDTGLDYTHPDLYLNVWLNQNEIKGLSFFSSITDTDKDGLITFRDLNSTVNQSFVTDVNANGRIDAGDLLGDNRWSDLRDNDANGYTDDLIGWDFANNDNNPYDDNNHGTHVSGTIGGIGGNGTGVAGVNWNTQLMALKFLNATGSGSTIGAINALNYYTNASIASTSGENFVATNNSWGGGGYSVSLEDAIVRSALNDQLFVAAAGNSTVNNDITASYPANYNTTARAGYDSVISVAALTSSGTLASYSNYGAQTVDLGASGSNITSTVAGGGYGTMSGTSMATPHVTGALGLFASIDPTASAAELRDILLGHTLATSSLTSTTATGGRLDISSMLDAIPAVIPVDTTSPTLNITLSDSALTTGETAKVTFAFSEAIKGFDATDIVVSGAAGILGPLTASADSTTFSAVFTPTTGILDSTNVFSVAPETYVDLAGNLGTGSTSSNFTIDTTATPQGVTKYGTTKSDVLVGTMYDDVLSGIPATGTLLGKGTVDKLTGQGGADLFVLGDARGAFYNDGNTALSGTKDYGLVMDFSVTEGDKIQLHVGKYFTTDVSLNGVKGAGIYLDTNGNSKLDTKTDELIGLVAGVSASQINPVEDYVFV